MAEKKKKDNYGASQIRVLEGLEAVRMRPGMYIGSTGEKGLHHLVYEIVDNSVDEALAGYCSTISVAIREDNSIRVEDDGRGMPVDMHPKEKKPAVEVKDRDMFFKVANAAFALRRKTMVNNLCATFRVERAQAVEWITAAGLDEKVRGEKLTLEELARLSDTIEL